MCAALVCACEQPLPIASSGSPFPSRPTMPAETTAAPGGGAEAADGADVTASIEVRPAATEAAVWTNAPAPLEMTLDASGSACPNDCTAFAWDFGDGSAPAEGPVVSHRYADAGTYAVTLVVIDAGGSAVLARRAVVIAPPVAAGPVP